LFLDKRFHVPVKASEDGYELAVQIINLAYISLTIIVFPGMLFFFWFTDNALSNLPYIMSGKLFQFLGFGGIAFRIMVEISIPIGTLAGSLVTINGGYCALLFSNAAIAYLNSTRLWIKKLK